MSKWRGKLKFLFIFLERREGRKGGREGQKHRSVASCTYSDQGDQTHNLGMFPDKESKLAPFTLWDNAQLTEPYQSG